MFKFTIKYTACKCLVVQKKKINFYSPTAHFAVIFRFEQMVFEQHLVRETLTAAANKHCLRYFILIVFDQYVMLHGLRAGAYFPTEHTDTYIILQVETSERGYPL